MRKLLRPSGVGVIGVVVLAASIIGATWVLRSGAGEGVQPTIFKQPGLNPRSTDPVTCMGFADVEPKVTALMPLQPGRVEDIPVKEDDIVKKGDILLKLDDRIAQYNVRQAEADLRAADAQLENAKKLPAQHQDDIEAQKRAIQGARDKLDAAAANAKRLRNLAEKQLGNPLEADAADAVTRAAGSAVEAEKIRLQKLESVDPQNQIEQAKQDVESKRAQLDKARYALSECNIMAPMDGKVLRILVGRGELVSPQSPQPVIQLAPVKPRIIRAELEQEFSHRVAVGARARIVDDSHSDIEWSGRVARMSDWFAQRRNVIREPLQFNDVRTLECIIELDKPKDVNSKKPAEPRIGQRVRVIIGEEPTRSTPASK